MLASTSTQNPADFTCALAGAQPSKTPKFIKVMNIIMSHNIMLLREDCDNIVFVRRNNSEVYKLLPLANLSFDSSYEDLIKGIYQSGYRGAVTQIMFFAILLRHTTIHTTDHLRRFNELTSVTALLSNTAEMTMPLLLMQENPGNFDSTVATAQANILYDWMALHRDLVYDTYYDQDFDLGSALSITHSVHTRKFTFHNLLKPQSITLTIPHTELPHNSSEVRESKLLWLFGSNPYQQDIVTFTSTYTMPYASQIHSSLQLLMVKCSLAGTSLVGGSHEFELLHLLPIAYTSVETPYTPHSALRVPVANSADFTQVRVYIQDQTGFPVTFGPNSSPTQITLSFVK